MMTPRVKRKISCITCVSSMKLVCILGLLWLNVRVCLKLVHTPYAIRGGACGDDEHDEAWVDGLDPFLPEAR